MDPATLVIVKYVLIASIIHVFAAVVLCPFAFKRWPAQAKAWLTSAVIVGFAAFVLASVRLFSFPPPIRSSGGYGIAMMFYLYTFILALRARLNLGRPGSRHP